MENQSTERQFREIIEHCIFDETSVTQRMLSAAADIRLVIAVQDEFSACIGMMFGEDDALQQHKQNYDNAQARLMEVVVNLQHSYGLTDEEMRGSVELTRTNIMKDGTLSD